MRAWLGVVLCTACGRVGFDPLGGGDGSPPPPPACEELPGILYCDGFEAPGRLDHEEAAPPSFIARDAEQVFRGAAALHAHTTRNIEPAWIIGSVLPAVTSGDLHVRWYLYLPSTNPSRTIASVHLVSDVPPNQGVVFGLTDGFGDVSSSVADRSDVSTVALPVDRWACIQLHVAIGASGSVETAIDGVPAARLTGIDTVPAGGYRNVHAGMFAGGGDLVLDLWTDELAVGTLPISCD